MALAAFGALAVGCAQEGDDAGGTLGPGSCAPNSTHSCLCPDQSIGQQFCAADGASVGACMCGSNAGTSAGMAGTGFAGTGGAAGQGGGGDGVAGTSAGTGGGASGAGGDGAAGTSGAAGTGEVDAGPTVPAGDEVPDSAHCAPVAAWDAEWVAFEDEVLRLVNENRAKGWNCDTEGQFGPTTALTTNKELRCAARLHSRDMNDRKYFAHNAPDGATPKTRMDAAGYVGTTWGENIAKGQTTPAEVVQGWMDSDGHCANIMSPMFKEIGVGYYEGAQTNQFYNENLYWTQNFGAPCTQSWCM